MAISNTSIYAGSLSDALIYQVKQGVGFEWAPHIRTEINVDAKPRQLKKAKHGGNPILANEKVPRQANTFDNAAGVTFDGKNLSVVELMVPEQIDANEWKEDFPRFQPTGTSIDLKTNPEIAQAVKELVIEATKTQMNSLHSAGDDSLIAPNPLRWYDGFETLIIADADATEVGTGTALTSGNIISRMFALRDSIPPRLRKNKNLKIFCSYADFDLYDLARRNTQDALPTTDLTGSDYIATGNGGKLQIVPVEGISKDFMFVTIAGTGKDSNLVQGVWLDNEEEALKVYREQEVDQVWNILLRFCIGVQTVTGDDIFYVQGV